MGYQPLSGNTVQAESIAWKPCVVIFPRRSRFGNIVWPGRAYRRRTHAELVCVYGEAPVIHRTLVLTGYEYVSLPELSFIELYESPDEQLYIAQNQVQKMLDNAAYQAYAQKSRRVPLYDNR